MTRGWKLVGGGLALAGLGVTFLALSAGHAPAPASAERRVTQCGYLIDNNDWAVSAVPGHPPHNGDKARTYRKGAWQVCHSSDTQQMWLKSDPGMMLAGTNPVQWQSADTTLIQAWKWRAHTDPANPGYTITNRQLGGVLCSTGGKGATLGDFAASGCGKDHKTWEWGAKPGLHGQPFIRLGVDPGVAGGRG